MGKIRAFAVLAFAGGLFATTQSQAAPGNFITITYLGEQIFRDGGVHRYPEVVNFLHSISAELNALENEASAAGHAAILEELPGSLDLDAFYLGVSRNVAFQFVSLGGGHFSLGVQGLAVWGSAYFSLDGASWLADGRIDFNTGSLEAIGTYDLFTGTASVVVTPPSISISADYGGIGLELANFISFGYLDNAFDDLVADFEIEANEAVAAAVSDLNFTTTLFGIKQFIPPNLYFHGIDVRAEIMGLISNIPDGNIVSAYFTQGINEYQSRFDLLLGANLAITLEHHNTNGTCVGSCRR